MKEENLTVDQECIFNHECIIRLYISKLSYLFPLERRVLSRYLQINRRTK